MAFASHLEFNCQVLTNPWLPLGFPLPHDVALSHIRGLSSIHCLLSIYMHPVCCDQSEM